MGSRFSVYEYTKETNVLLPPSIARDAMFVTDVTPADRWNYELLEENGELKMKTLVASVKEMCAETTECTSTSYIFSDHFQFMITGSREHNTFLKGLSDCSENRLGLKPSR